MARPPSPRTSAPRAFRAIPSWIGRITQGAPRSRTALCWTLLLSLIVHSVLAPLVPRDENLAAGAADRFQSEYQRKIEAAKHARVMVHRVREGLTPPPPPPDPEAFVSATLAGQVTADIEAVVTKVADVRLSERLARGVKASLKDELAEATRQILSGNLSEDEIHALQERLKAKAHESALKHLKTDRIETQVERAAMSTTEWYERNLAPDLLRCLEIWFFDRKQGCWNTLFSQHGLYVHHLLEGNPPWHRLMSEGHLRGKVAALRDLLQGGKAAGEESESRTAREEAEQLATALADIHETALHPEGHSRAGSKRSLAWSECVNGGACLNGIIEEYHPHRREAKAAMAGELEAAWSEVLARAKAYRASAESGAAGAELGSRREACLALVRTIADRAERELLVADPKPYQTIQDGVRTDVLRSAYLQEMHRYLIDLLVKELAPVIETYARGQFEEGIIVWDKQAEQSKDEFGKQIVPLLRRDLENLLSSSRFAQIVFVPYRHESAVTGTRGPPNDAQAAAEIKEMERVLAAVPALKAYADARRELVRGQFKRSLDHVAEKLMESIFEHGLLMRGVVASSEGVDQDDRVEQQFDARRMALEGRGQDLASLTPEGLPDTGASQVALKFAGARHGRGFAPVATDMSPAFVPPSCPARGLRSAAARLPAASARWKNEEQPKLQPAFKGKSPRFEAIPFLAQFVHLDGDPSDWGDIRPLVLHGGAKNAAPVLLWAAWNYQGFFFCCRVNNPAERFFYASRSATSGKARKYGEHVRTTLEEGWGWASRGDHLRLFFDTLDARAPTRGDPHTQEFLILPRGTMEDPDLPGVERIIESKRDAAKKGYRDVVDTALVFPRQLAAGPDGSGPYRVCRFGNDGYTVEVFLPRSLFKVPVFAPGWHIGFDAAVATGSQGKHRQTPTQYWSGTESADDRKAGTAPNAWGDLLLLGTDARVLVQDAGASGRLSDAVLPGHSYLITVIDPDRNIDPIQKDAVVVTAEVVPGGEDQAAARDVEVFVLREMKENSGIFRGYVDTQPALGESVQGVLELAPLQEIWFGYVDVADGKGQRNCVTRLKLPVAAPLLGLSDANRRGAR